MSILVMAPAATIAIEFTYRKLLKPRHAELFAHIKQSAKTDVKVLLHSCGSVRPLIPDLIETGIDALNPIQVSAANMDTKELKREFGSELSFWGGGVDTQQTLPFGTPEQVREQVKERVRIFSQKNGFIFNAIHNIQCNTPVENVLAMFEALGRDV